MEMTTATLFFLPGESIPTTSQTPSTWNGTNPLAIPQFSEAQTSSSLGKPGGDPGGSEGLPAAGQVHVCHQGGGELKALRIKLLLCFLSEAGRSGIGLGGGGRLFVQAGMWGWGLIVGAGHRWTFPRGLEGSERSRGGNTYIATQRVSGR